MKPTVLGLFDSIEKTAKTAGPILDLSIEKKDISLLTAGPYPDGAYFHEDFHPPIWKVAFVGGLLGLCAGLFIAGWTQWIINLNVGGKDPVSFPVVALICYETTNLGIVLGSFLSLFWFARLPNWTDLAYDEEISNGRIGVLVQCEDSSQASKVEDIFNSHGAIGIKNGRGDY